MRMTRLFNQVNQDNQGSQANRLSRLALPLTLLGLAGVVAHNWRLWQRDRAMVAQREPPTPLPPLSAWASLPLVTILVAAWNEADLIAAHIERVLGLRYPHKQLVLCAGGTDQTYQIAQRYAGEQVQVLEQHAGEGKQAALERGLALAHGTLIYFTDADCLLDDETFERLIYVLACEGEQAATGASMPLPEQQTNSFVQQQWAPPSYIHGSNRDDYDQGLLGRNCAVTKEWVVQAWQPRRRIVSGTDYYLALRLRQAGVAIRRVPASVIATRFPTSVPAYVRQQRRWLRNVVQLGFAYGAPAEAARVMQTTAVGIMMLALPLGAVRWRVAGGVWVILLTHALLARLRYLWVLRATARVPIRQTTYLLLLPMLGLDWVIWSRAALDFGLHPTRWQW